MLEPATDDIKLISQDGVSIELQKLVEELQALINNGTRIFKLTGEKILEIYHCAIEVDGYSPKQAYKFIEKLVCEPELMSKRHLRRIIPEEAKDQSKKNLYIKHDADICPHHSLNSSVEDNDELEIRSSHKIIEVESESYNDDKENIKEDGIIIDDSYNWTEEKLKKNKVLRDNIQLSQLGQNLVKDLKNQLKEKNEIIKNLKKEKVQLKKKIEDLNLQLALKKQSQIIRFKKNMELREDKIIPLMATCYCGGTAEDHIILLDIKKFDKEEFLK